MSIVGHYGDDDIREWIYERAGGAENVEDVYDLPSHLLLAGQRYELSVKLMSLEDGLKRVLDARTLNFRLGNYDPVFPQQIKLNLH